MAIFLVSAATQHVDDYYIKNRSPLVIFTGIKQQTKNDLHKITKHRKKQQKNPYSVLKRIKIIKKLFPLPFKNSYFSAATVL